MKKYFLVVVIILIIIALSGCSSVQRSIKPGFGPAVEGEEQSYKDSVITYYLTFSYFIIGGNGEIWVESNFLSYEKLFDLAKNFSAGCPYATVDSLDYSSKKTGKLLSKSYHIVTCFIRGEKIEVEAKSNMGNGVIAIIWGVFPYEELPSLTEKHGYFIIFKKENIISPRISTLKNHWDYPVVFLFDKDQFLG